MKKSTNVVEQSVHLPTVEVRRMAVRLNGETPLIVHRFEEKAITEMLAKQRGLPFERQKKNPHADYEASKYKNVKDQDCIPVMTVKKAMVEAATFSDDMTKKQTRGGFMIIGEYAPLDFGEVRLRQDMVRLSGIGRTPDIRFRAEYLDWSVDLVIEFNPRLITTDQILYLLRSAGTAVGICEWRIQKDGNYGAFSVEPLDDKMIESIVADCKVPRKPYNLPEWVMREINSEDDLKAAVDAAKKASGTGTSTGRGRKAAAPAVEVVDETEGETEEAPAPKRRGRPPGSKNGANGHGRAHADEAH
jgi:hypothetical protein